MIKLKTNKIFIKGFIEIRNQNNKNWNWNINNQQDQVVIFEEKKIH